MHTLVVQTGKSKGRKIAIPDKEVVIGRDEDCFIRLTSSDVSRRHCSLKPTPKGLLVRDLSSQNGTIVNGVAIETESLVQPGDMLQVGPMQFQVAGRQAAKQQSGFDDHIAEWLSESDTSTGIPTTSDTTIVKGTSKTTPAAVAPPKVPSKPKFETVAEEARDIIRRHFESLRDQEEQEK